jgi:hypothetical protein
MSAAVTKRSLIRLAIARIHSLQVGWDVVDQLPWRLRFVVTDLSQEFSRIGSAEGCVAAQHFVENDAKTIDVGVSVDAMRFRPFRRHIARRPGYEAELLSACSGLVEPEAEVDQHRMLFRREDDVGWLDVAMDRPLTVSVRERIGDRGDDAGGIQPIRPVRDQPLSEARPTQKIGDDVDLPVMRADVMHGHDTGCRSRATRRALRGIDPRQAERR